MKDQIKVVPKEVESTETPMEENQDYSHIDEFLASLDEDEKSYLCDKLESESMETESSEKAEEPEDKVLDVKDMEEEE